MRSKWLLISRRACTSTFGHEDGGTGTAIAKALIEHAERMRYRFAVLDSGPGQSIEHVWAMRAAFTSAKAALYYPGARVKNPSSSGNLSLPPSGFVAGIYARGDLARGVGKLPANEVVKLAVGLDDNVTEAEQAMLNAESINCIRAAGPRNFRVWGARTLSTDSEWKYVNVRRLFMYLEASIDRGTQWAVSVDIPVGSPRQSSAHCQRWRVAHARLACASAPRRRWGVTRRSTTSLVPTKAARAEKASPRPLSASS
jgi:phage tail sheath protein FI